MRYLRMFYRRLTLAPIALAAWLVSNSSILAQGLSQPAPKKDATTGTGPYVMAYMLVLLCVALGMLVVCRSSNRRDRARPEVFVESSLVEQKK
ncbi:MAG: hypothetical protein ABFC96_15190 [Thermoguttaceae bacterium]